MRGLDNLLWQRGTGRATRDYDGRGQDGIEVGAQLGSCLVALLGALLHGFGDDGIVERLIIDHTPVIAADFAPQHAAAADPVLARRMNDCDDF